VVMTDTKQTYVSVKSIHSSLLSESVKYIHCGALDFHKYKSGTNINMIFYKNIHFLIKYNIIMYMIERS